MAEDQRPDLESIQEAVGAYRDIVAGWMKGAPGKDAGKTKAPPLPITAAATSSVLSGRPAR